jgi:hypothetical protein
LLVDYLLPKLYVTDLLIGLLFLTWLVEWWRSGHHRKNLKNAPRSFVLLGAMAAVLLFVAQFNTAKPLAAFWFLEKVIAMVLLGGFFLSHRQFFREKAVIAALMVMLTMQSVIGIAQFFSQSSVFPSYAWFGETRLEQRGGVARGVFFNTERLLPYGTTSHPNVFAGVLAIGLLALWTTVRASEKKDPTTWIRAAEVVITVLVIFALGLSQSWSAWLSLSGGCAALWLQHRLRTHHRNEEWGRAIMAGILTAAVLAPFVLHQLARSFPDNLSLTRRTTLNQAAFGLWEVRPLLGVGLDQFTAQVETAQPTAEIVRFVQPVHHVGLLILAEIGVVGILLNMLFLATIYRHLKRSQQHTFWAIMPYVAVAFLPLATLDHFLWTQQIGQLTLIIGGIWIAAATRFAE